MNKLRNITLQYVLSIVYVVYVEPSLVIASNNTVNWNHVFNKTKPKLQDFYYKY